MRYAWYLFELQIFIQPYNLLFSGNVPEFYQLGRLPCEEEASSYKVPKVLNFLLEFFKMIPSVANPGCLTRISDPTFYYPGSWIRIFPSRIRIKEFKYFNPKKWFLSSRKYDPDCSSWIPDPDPYFLPIPDPGL
jgi:hypothetical protein